MEAVRGSRLIYLFRRHSQATTAGNILAFTTDNSRSVSNDADSTVTKNGVIRTPGEPEIEITATSIMAKDDDTVKTYEQAMLAGELFDIWEVNLDSPSTTSGKYEGTYYQGYLTSLDKNSNPDNYVEVSWTFGVNGKGATGDVTVTAEQIEQASYVFTDATGTTGST